MNADSKKYSRHATDVATAFLLMMFSVAWSVMLSGRLNPALFVWDIDLFFDSDVPRILMDMTDRFGAQADSAVHPLFPLTVIPLMTALQWAFSIDSVTAARALLAALAAFWSVGLYFSMRLVGCRIFDASLFSVAATLSAASTFWFAVPETFAFSSLSLVLALLVAALVEHRKLSDTVYVVTSAITLGYTITNWMAGMVLSIVNLPWRRAARVTAYALVLVAALWGLQKYFVPNSAFLLDIRGKFAYVMSPEMGGASEIIPSIFWHSMVAPAIGIAHQGPPHTTTIQLSFQHSPPGSSGVLGVVATVSWTLLLALGLWGAISKSPYLRFRVVLGLVLVGQVILHLLFGEETFLYALHFAPLLLLLASFSVHTRLRGIALLLGVIFIATAAPNNWAQFGQAATFFEQDVVKPRAEVMAAMTKRPADPWPRGVGHVVLAPSGSQLEQKGYHEPGGSFSPSPGSFGLSVWVTDRIGKVITTSDQVPISELRQSFDWFAKRTNDIPAIHTATPYYRARWSRDESGWMLDLAHANAHEGSLVVAVRGVGPAGGPIYSLDWDGRQLLINGRWLLTVTPMPVDVSIGEEGISEWMSLRSNNRKWKGETGWGYARIELGAGEKWQIRLRDTQERVVSKHLAVSETKKFELTLPDPQFEQAIRAQIAHLQMGTVGNETRNADPVADPVPWANSAAYVVSALARAGETRTAQTLSRYLAENDFFGGFGAEADAPGLALWALREVAALVNDPEFERWLWPHVHRKANVILELLEAKEPVHRAGVTAVLPYIEAYSNANLVAESARDGLIVGRVGLERPVLYVNAIAYRGLLDAAWFAARRGDSTNAQRYSTRAAMLQQRWLEGYRRVEAEKLTIYNNLGAKIVSKIEQIVFHRPPPGADDERLYGSALWPTWMAAPNKESLNDLAAIRWSERRDEFGAFKSLPYQWRSYFDVADAHQWLYLGDVSRVWQTLTWFFEHQTSPGLYTWHAGHRDGDTFYGWYQIRGWVHPLHVTPHYRTAAEMLLLQLEMLAYIDESENDPVLVIGGGVPPDWLQHPLEVKGLLTPRGRVDWRWKNGVMYITLSGKRLINSIRLGPAFPIDTPIRITRTRS